MGLEWLTGRGAEAQSVYKDDTKVDELKADLNGLELNVSNAKTVVQQTIDELNNVNGMDRIGSINKNGFDEAFDSLELVIKKMREAVETKAEEINNYANASTGEKVLSSTLGFFVSAGTGLFGAVEGLIDSGLSLVGGAAGFLTGGATDDFWASLIEPDVSGNISRWYYNTELGQKCCWTEDSNLAYGLELIGSVGGNAALLAFGVPPTAILGLVALESVGNVAENSLLAGDTFNNSLKNAITHPFAYPRNTTQQKKLDNDLKDKPDYNDILITNSNSPNNNPPSNNSSTPSSNNSATSNNSSNDDTNTDSGSSPNYRDPGDDRDTRITTPKYEKTPDKTSNLSTKNSTETNTNVPKNNPEPNSASNIVFSNTASNNLSESDNQGQNITTPSENVASQDNPTPAASVPTGEVSHTGGGYTEDGYLPEENMTEDGSILDSEEINNEDISDSISSIIGTDDNITRIPISNTPIKSSSSSGSAVIPVVAGLSAAAAAGIGAKSYIDGRKNNDNDEDDFETEEWTGEDNLDMDYNDNIEENEYLNETSDFGISETQEKYGARTNDELADLQ